jgi:hypothetical protein
MNCSKKSAEENFHSTRTGENTDSMLLLFAVPVLVGEIILFHFNFLPNSLQYALAF